MISCTQFVLSGSTAFKKQEEDAGLYEAVICHVYLLTYIQAQNFHLMRYMLFKDSMRIYELLFLGGGGRERGKKDLGQD